jgi:hypothetical protein
MSHKYWYVLFNPTTLKWEERGIPIDDGRLENVEELFVGPFRTRRAANYLSMHSGSNMMSYGTIRNIEALAKIAEEMGGPNKEVLEDKIETEHRSSYTQQLIEGMIG